MAPVAYPIFALLGLAIGSFLNVVAWRVPRGESVVKPGSHCPGCDAPLKPYDNIPLLSWLFLRGRCRTCKTKISVRYPLVELTTGALYVGIAAYWWEDWREFALGIVLTTFLIPITAIDLDVKRIPNALTLPAALLAVPIAAVTEPSFIPEQLIAGAAATFFFLLPALIAKKGMGMGDVKLAGVMGLYLGAAVAPAIMIALLAGTVVGIAVIMRTGVSKGRKTAVPFGPFLALGSVVSIFAGASIIDAYLGTF
jgi:leader peptidase (prepilin peptidase)/N-methyltransferase